MRDIEMERMAKSLEQDVDAVGRKNNVLRQLVARCVSTSPEIIEDPFFFEGCPYHDAAPIRPTISGQFKFERKKFFFSYLYLLN